MQACDVKTAEVGARDKEKARGRERYVRSCSAASVVGLVWGRCGEEDMVGAQLEKVYNGKNCIFNNTIVINSMNCLGQ